MSFCTDVNTYRAAVAAGKPGLLNFALGTALVLVGVPIYFFYRKRNGTAACTTPSGA